MCSFLLLEFMLVHEFLIMFGNIKENYINRDWRKNMMRMKEYDDK